jgi:hypothetical protein
MLTPGDFKSLLSRTQFTDDLSAVDLVLELEIECSFKATGSTIGFHV